MAKLSILAGSTSQTVNIFVQDSSSIIGAGLAGLVYNTSGLTAYYALPKAAPVAITLATLAAATTAYSSGGFFELDATHTKGLYRLDLPDAALASGRFVNVYVYGAANMAPVVLEIELTATNNQDAVHGGMSALPNTACTTNASLLTSGTGTDQLSVTTGRIDIGKALGTAITLDANNVINVSAKYWAGTAITATSIPVATAAGAAGGLFIAGTNAATAVTTSFTTTFTGNLTGSVGSVTGAVGSVTGAVGSVTGSVGSVTGAVGSVTGAVGSVTGNVGGNVTGTVASIVSPGNIWDVINTGATHNVTNSTGKQLRLVNPTSDVIYTNTAVAGAASTITLDSGASSSDNAYQYDIISILSGTGPGQSRVISSYVGSTRVCTVDSAWTVNPDNTSVFEITPSSRSTVINRTGFSLAATGLDLITVTAPSTVATTFPAMLVQVWRRYFKKTVKAVSGLTIKTYADDTTTVVTTQTYTDDGAGNETLNAAS